MTGDNDDLYGADFNPALRNDWSDIIPDVRDGLTRPQRIVMYEIYKAQKESGREFVPTVMLYGRVLEHINISEHELNQILQSLGVMGEPPQGKQTKE